MEEEEEETVRKTDWKEKEGKAGEMRRKSFYRLHSYIQFMAQMAFLFCLWRKKKRQQNTERAKLLFHVTGRQDWKKKYIPELKKFARDAAGEFGPNRFVWEDNYHVIRKQDDELRTRNHPRDKKSGKTLSFLCSLSTVLRDIFCVFWKRSCMRHLSELSTTTGRPL